MAFDKTQLSEYVSSHAKEISMKAISGAKTAKLLMDNMAFQAGVKETARVNRLDADVVLQDGSSCGRSASGNTQLSDVSVTVKGLKDVQDFCPKTLYDTFYAALIAKGRNPEDESVSDELMGQIMDYRAQLNADVVEQLLWKGDTGLTGNISRINGFIKQIKAGNYINVDPEGTIATFGSITAGSTYTNGSYTDVPLTGGSGTGATANITVSGNAVTAVTLVNGGFGYKVSDSLSAAAADIGGTGSGFAVPVATVSTPLATKILKLQGAYKKMPVAIRRDPSFRIFIGEDFWEDYLVEIDAANKFREASQYTLTGTAATLEPVPGLNETNVAVLARIKDLHLGLDGLADQDKAVLKYNDNTELWQMDFHYAVGVVPVRVDQIGFVDFGN